MTSVIRKAPLFVQDLGAPVAAGHTKGHVGALVWHSDPPGVVSLVLAASCLDVTVEGFTAGLSYEFAEPSGGISMRPHVDSAGGEWLVVEVDTAVDSVQVTVAADRAFEFLADVALAACVGGVRVPEPVDVAEDVSFRPLRSEGGPL